MSFEHLTNSFSFYSYANLTIGEQYPHEPDGYELEKLIAKVKKKKKSLLRISHFYLLEYTLTFVLCDVSLA